MVRDSMMIVTFDYYSYDIWDWPYYHTSRSYHEIKSSK